MARDFNSDGGSGSNGRLRAVYIAVAGAPIVKIFPLNYTYKKQCALLGSPSEAGVTMYDHKVVQPSTISFNGIVKYTNFDVFEEFKLSVDSHKLSDILCDFYTKAQKVKKMIIESVEEVGDNHRFDGVEVRIQMKEYLEHNTRGK